MKLFKILKGPAVRKVADLQRSVPSGVLIGRASSGDGPAEYVKIADPPTFTFPPGCVGQVWNVGPSDGTAGEWGASVLGADADCANWPSVNAEAVVIKGGAGSATFGPVGASVTMSGGAAGTSGAVGGGIIINSGASSTHAVGTKGNIQIYTGNNGNESAGLEFFGTGSGAVADSFTMYGGNSASSSNLQPPTSNITAGAGDGSGQGGTLSLTGGSAGATASLGGTAQLEGGNSGGSNSCSGGVAIVIGGTASVSANTNGGDVQITGAPGHGTGHRGDVIITGRKVTINGTDIATAATGTSGGIPYYNTTTSLTSSALLAANALVVGGGAGTAPSTNSDWTIASNILTGNLNTAAVPSPVSGIAMQISQADGSGTGVELDAAAAATQFIGYRVDGTQASPSALLAGQTIFSLAAQGYDGSVRTGNVCNIQFAALNAWVHSSDTSSKLNLRVVPSGSTTIATHGLITAQGCAFTGTNTNDSASAGQIGEYVSSIVLIANEVSLTTATLANITSVSLTGGDWNVWGEVWFDAAATTVVTFATGGISTANNTFATTPADGTAVATTSFGASGTINTTGRVLAIAPCQVPLTGTTNYYLNVEAAFTTSTLKAYGKLCARRAR